MSSKDKWIRRFSVNDTAKHKNGFTLYKITSILFPIESPEDVTVVCVWKRYSDARKLHKSVRALHAGLHLHGRLPELPRHNYFSRFDAQVVQERAKAMKNLMEFVAEHRLLFTSTEFVNFLQSGYPPPENTQTESSTINTIRTSLQLPFEDHPPLEYRSSDDDNSGHFPPRSQDAVDSRSNMPSIDTSIQDIPIYKPFDVEIRSTPKLTQHSSNESLHSLESLSSDLYDDIRKVNVNKSVAIVKTKPVLPDLINFDAPSTSRFDDYHTMSRTDMSESISISSTQFDSKASVSRMSMLSRNSVLSLSDIESKTRMENSYVFEAGYLINMAARCEKVGDYQKAFDYYKSGIEKMLVGVRSDPDPKRKAIIKEKTNKYLSYAENIYNTHLCGQDAAMPSEPQWCVPAPTQSISSLCQFRVLSVIGGVMLVMGGKGQTCYAMKVIRKIPINLTENFLQTARDTKVPILPKDIPYMVPLQNHIETSNLIFLVLTYAPGEKLFDYIKNYAKSTPNTPAREVNLENVLLEPKNATVKNKNDQNEKHKNDLDQTSRNDADKNKTDDELDVNELVINSQRLLLNVDRVLNDENRFDGNVNDLDDENDATNKSVEIEIVDRENRQERDTKRKEIEDDFGTPLHIQLCIRRQSVLPPSTTRAWAAQILTAIHSLHTVGVICRDLNPNNILLSEGGQVILTYIVGYSGLDASLAVLHKYNYQYNVYIAPEIYVNTILDGSCMGDMEKVCDFWSFGAILYELICGVPLSHFHNTMFSSHTLLQLPDGLDYEAQSLLTQLLTYDPAERLGSGGITEIQNHPYFKHVDWRSVRDSWIIPG